MIQTNIITNALDVIAGFEFMQPHEQREILRTFIDALGSYPKPRKKGDTSEPKAKFLGSYLFVSKARSTAKLCLIGCIDNDDVAMQINRNLNNALTLLVE